MRIRRARQILKSFADDTRIRIINLLSKEPLNVSELCTILGVAQSNTSKHLARLRLTGVVSDKRAGFNVYYKLTQPENSDHRNLVNYIVKGLSSVEITKHDTDKLKEVIKGRKRLASERKKEVKNG